MLRCSWGMKSGSWPRLVCYLKLEYIQRKELCKGSLVVSVLLAWFLTPGVYPGAPAVLMATGSLHWEQHCQLETIVSDSCLSAGTIAPLMGCSEGERASFVWQCRHGRWLIGHDKPQGQWGRKRRSAGIISLYPLCQGKKIMCLLKMLSTLALCHECIIQ